MNMQQKWDQEQANKATHTKKTPEQCKCNKEDGECYVCDYGLFVCTVCGAAEVETMRESCQERQNRGCSYSSFAEKCKPSPLPWKIDGFRIYDADDHMVAEIKAAHWMTPEQVLANAQYIADALRLKQEMAESETTEKGRSDDRIRVVDM